MKKAASPTTKTAKKEQKTPNPFNKMTFQEALKKALITPLPQKTKK